MDEYRTYGNLQTKIKIHHFSKKSKEEKEKKLYIYLPVIIWKNIVRLIYDAEDMIIDIQIFKNRNLMFLTNCFNNIRK